MGKRLNEAAKLVDKNRIYELAEAVALAKETAKAKFDETIEIHIKLGVDPKRSDQMVRGTTSLPHGTGRIRKIAVLAKGEKQKEAKAAGADIIGSDDLIEDISKGKFNFVFLDTALILTAFLATLTETFFALSDGAVFFFTLFSPETFALSSCFDGI